MSNKEKEKCFDQQINRDVLIASVKDRPLLWNKFLDEYRDKTAKTAAWREICIILKEDFEEMELEDRKLFVNCVMKRWTQIRDTWKKSLSDNKVLKRFGFGAKSRPYKYDQEMSFLKLIMKPGETHDSNPSTRDEIERQFDDEQADDSNQALIKQEENLEETRSESSSKKKRGESSSDVDDKMLRPIEHQLNTIGSNDRNLNFFLSILPSLQFFDDDQILEFQSGVIDLIQNIETRRNH